MFIMNTSSNTVLFSGIAKVPHNAPYYQQKQEISCVIEVDMDTHRIISCEFGKLKTTTNQFLSKLIIGYDVGNGMDALAEAIRKRCQIISKNAVIKTLEICHIKYTDYLKNECITR